ncbi:MAG TPA: L-seryl-tRNA(Sec) selenium transferase [Bryobacteraceae bacterium]|jgi:L-seryl-tRNA(Ser) seleniumtransferase
MDRRSLPSVHEVYERLAQSTAAWPRELVIHEIRTALENHRRSDRDAGALDQEVLDALAALRRPSLRRVINATGVILHTNLGRAPLGPASIEPGYTNLEYDLSTGRRGKRDTHLSSLLERLLGTPAIAVNNGAAAVFLVLNELAAGQEAIVSRGELIEIGDGFRIPEIMVRSGVVLREIGTTNRTSLDDYAQAITDRTRVLLRVHRSNFRMTGFTAQPSLESLAAMGKERGIPVYEDLGSGCLVDLKPYGIDEPLAQTSLASGADLISFSGDKLLGGPQAGIIAGRPELVARVRRNPMYRALRLDKMSVQVLSATLRRLVLGQYDEVPALRMIRQSAEQIRERAGRMASQLAHSAISIQPGESVIGGGSTPEQPLATWLIVIAGASAVELEKRLRAHTPPVIARIERDRLVIDLRTVSEEEEGELMRALGTCLPRC